ncbi:MAG: hypothetical protein ACOX6T_00295 [Myxococcales bacterium]|jgi:hypothetical protein
MRAAVVLCVLLFVGCGPLPEEMPLIGLDVADAPSALSDSGDDTLFYLRYCNQQEDGPRFRVNRLMVGIEARNTQYATVYSLRYELSTDVDGDGQFGPGDVITVSEAGRNSFDQRTSGIFKVSLFDTASTCSCPLGMAQWDAL